MLPKRHSLEPKRYDMREQPRPQMALSAAFNTAPNLNALAWKSTQNQKGPPRQDATLLRPQTR